MTFIDKYFFKHSKQLELPSQVRRLDYRIGYGIFGIIIFIILWGTTGYFVFGKPGYEQFSGLLPMPTIKALYSLMFDSEFWSSAYASLRRVVVGIFIGTFAAGFYVLPLVILRVLHRRDYIAYGPFIAIGAVVALFWGDPIWDWYFDR